MHVFKQATGDLSVRYPGIILILFFVLGAPFGASAQTWEKVWVTNRGEGLSAMPQHPSIAVDSNQALHVLFVESDGVDADDVPSTFDATFRYATNANGAFGSSHPIASVRGTLYSSLSIDSSSTLHPIFTSDDGSGIPCLRHAELKESSWEKDFPTGCDVRQAYPAVAVDRAGTIHIAYENGESIYYRRRSSDGIWSDPINVSQAPLRDRTPSIAVAPDGTVHLLFYRWNSATRRILMYAAIPAGGTAFTLPESLRVMSGTREGLDVPLSSPQFVPSITVDRGGVCHVVFTSVFGISADQSQILYMHNATGSWSTPVAVTEIGLYNRASIVVAADGGLHIAAERYDASGADWDMIYARNVTGSWEPEQDLTTNGFDDFAPANGGRFIEARGIGLAIIYQTREPNPNSSGPTAAGEIVVLTKELAPLPVLSVEVDEIDFDTIRSETCRDTTIVVTNAGAGTITVQIPTFDGGSAQFKMVDAELLQLDAGESDTIHLSFCPQSGGCFDEVLRITSDVGVRLVRLHGCAIEPIKRRVWLDTVSGHVGDRLLLTATLDPAPTAVDNIEGFSLTLSYDVRAIYPHRIVDQGDVMFQRNPDGSIVLTRSVGSPILDPVLFVLEIEGLVTGQSENRVAIDDIELNGAVGEIDTGHGLVRLQGCDIESGVAFGKAVRIGTIAPFPVGRHGTITWRAPLGFSPTLRIIDPQGRVIQSLTLPAGTDAEQHEALDVEGLAPGWYLLELIDRAEHHAVPLLIAE